MIFQQLFAGALPRLGLPWHGDPHKGYSYLIIGCGSGDGQIVGKKDLTEVASSSVMSEDGIQLCDLQQIVYPLGEVEQLQFAALATHVCERTHQFTQT